LGHILGVAIGSSSTTTKWLNPPSPSFFSLSLFFFCLQV